MAYEVIARQSAPASNVFDFTGLDLSGYEGIQVKMIGLRLGTDDADVLFQVYVGGSLITSGYHVASNVSTSGASNDSMAASSGSSIALTDTSLNFGVGNDTGENFSGLISLYNPTASVNKLFGMLSERTTPSGGGAHERGGGKVNNTGTIDGIKISVSTGTLTDGVVVIQGMPV